jgi:hypothetical protein
MNTRCLAVILVFCGLLLQGCGLRMATTLSAAGPAIELERVPFHPQTEYQCGPAALATVLGAAGQTVTPDSLVEQVYVPARKGSLPPEMLGAARRHDVVPVPFDDTRTPLDTLDAALRAGTPVLVMQNLGTRFFPTWHYAVVIGLDAAAGTVLLRSGTEARQTLSLRRFERSWRGSGYWAFTVHEADAPPAWARLPDWMQTVAVWERTRPARGIVAAKAAAAHWPDHPAPWLALGNLYHARDDTDAAVAAFRKAQLLKPSVGGAHNLAILLAMEGCPEHARAALDGLPSTMQSHPALHTARERVQALASAPSGAACAF